MCESPSLTFVAASLATWRIARFIVAEEGPWNIGGRARAVAERIGLGTLTRCMHCVSVWASLAIALLVFPFDKRMIVLWLGIAGAASLLVEVAGSIRRIAMRGSSDGP
jgi:hypothetical protein